MRQLLVIWLAGCALIASFNVQGERTLSLAMGLDWKPYLYLDEQGNPSGDDLRLLRRVLNKLDYSLTIQALPEQRMALEIIEGDADVILGAAFTHARHAMNFYSIPYRQETIVFGYLANRHPSFASASAESLLAQGGWLAVNKSGWFGSHFHQQALTRYNANLVHAEGTERRMQLLVMNRVDAVIGDRKVLLAAARAQGLADFVVSEQVIHKTDVHFLFSRERVEKAFVTEFNRLLAAELRSD